MYLEGKHKQFQFIFYAVNIVSNTCLFYPLNSWKRENVGILTSQINIDTFISIILPLQSWLMVAPII